MNYLAETARLMLADRKGLLAMDESNGTYDKRSAKAGITQTAEARRRYRELIITTPGFAEWISGVILYDETIRQARADRTPFVKVIAGLGIIPGIKVDTGAKDLAGHVGEKITEALDGLRELTGSDEPEAASPANLPSRARAADGTTMRGAAQPTFATVGLPGTSIATDVRTANRARKFTGARTVDCSCQDHRRRRRAIFARPIRHGPRREVDRSQSG